MRLKEKKKGVVVGYKLCNMFGWKGKVRKSHVACEVNKLPNS